MSFKQQQLEMLRTLGEVLNFSYDLQRINRLAKHKPKDLVKTAEDFYAWQIDEICENVISSRARIVFVAGPSSAGKTTSSNKLAAAFKKRRLKAHVISMDDFFIDKVNTPRTPDGNYDFENVTAVDIPYFKQFLKDALGGKEAILPHYDFVLGKRTTLKPFVMGKKDKIIIEGLHALNPLFQEGLEKNEFYKVYVSVASNFTIGGNVVIAPKQIRFMRRLLRDYYKRAATVSTTLEMWHRVVEGENKYILPFKAEADFILNTTHMYEPLLYDKYLRPVLKVSSGQEIVEIMEIFNRTGQMDDELVPKNSLIREFLV